MVIQLPPQITELFPFPLLTVGSRRRESQFGIASLSDIFRDPPNNLNTRIWKILASSGVLEVNKGILSLETVSLGQSFVRVKDKHSWKGSRDGAAVWQARIKITRVVTGVQLLCEFGLINSGQTKGMFFWADGSDSRLTPEVDDGSQQSGTPFIVLDNVWHTYKIEANSSNQIKFYLDNVLKATLTDSNDIPWTYELFPYFRVWDSGGSEEATIDCNWMKMSF